MADVRILNITKQYAGKRVLDSFSLDIRDGECFTLLGPSGCGKTVLLRLIAGFETLDSGAIEIGGETVSDAASNLSLSPDRRKLGVVFQDYAIWPHMSVYENIAYPLKLAKLETSALHEQTMQAIRLVGLDKLEARLPSQLSGGQQQRVALARALISNPRLILLDEPLNNLDANLREEMRFEIKALQQKLGCTIFYITHDQEIALGIADRIAVMDDKGRLRQIGAPDEVYEHPSDDFVFRFLGIANLLPVRRKEGGLYIGENAAPWSGVFPGNAGDLMTAGFRPSDVSISRQGGNGAEIAGVIRRASFLGAQMDYLIDVAGMLVRAALPSHECIHRNLLFVEGDSCWIRLEAVQWFEGEITKR